ncbi:MAG: NACHT domain-containing protein [Cyanobacteria bacterium P01_D01_bin.1]
MALLESAISGIAISVFDQAIKVGKYAAKEIRAAYSKVEHDQRVIAASNAYIDNYISRQCKIKIMPGLMKEPLDLEKIYTAVQLLNDKSRRLFTDSELEKSYRTRGEQGCRLNNMERLKGMDVANSKQFLMVLGGPGIGKSTFLRKIGLETLKKDGQIQHRRIPVFLELKRFREAQIDIKRRIIEEFEICKFPAPEKLVEFALEQRKLLILLDGLDEVPSQSFDCMIERIEDFVSEYHNNSSADSDDGNRFVASCRVAAHRSSLLPFTDVTIAEFDDQQIQQFICRWFSSEEDRTLGTANKYRELLFQSKNMATKELAKTPLLLTFLCLVYDREQTLPNKRSALYDRALNIILYEWSAQRRIERDPIYEELNPDIEKLMLAEIAYDSFKQDRLFFSKYTVADQIKRFLFNTLDAPKYIDANKVLTAIEVQQGILVERVAHAYSFSHLTLQEYLVALYIVRERKGRKSVDEHLTDENWREVFLLMSGLMLNRSIQLLIYIDQKARAYITPYPKLQKLVEWAAVNKVGPSELSQRVAMLAVVSAFSINGAIAIDSIRASVLAFDIARTSATAIESIFAIDSVIDSAVASANAISSARDIDGVNTHANTIDSTDAIKGAVYSTLRHHLLNARVFKIISTNLSIHQNSLPTDVDLPEVWQTWADQLQSIWLEALELNLDDITFSYEEAQALQDYLYANELLIQCKEAAIRVSRSEWEALERRLLTMDDGTAAADA